MRFLIFSIHKVSNALKFHPLTVTFPSTMQSCNWGKYYYMSKFDFEGFPTALGLYSTPQSINSVACVHIRLWVSCAVTVLVKLNSSDWCSCAVLQWYVMWYDIFHKRISAIHFSLKDYPILFWNLASSTKSSSTAQLQTCKKVDLPPEESKSEVQNKGKYTTAAPRF